MSLHVQRARCKISYNKNLADLQYKIIKMICKILTQYQSYQQGLAQKLFEREGHENVGLLLAGFCFVIAESTIIQGDLGACNPGKFAKLHSNKRNLSAFWKHF